MPILDVFKKKDEVTPEAVEKVEEVKKDEEKPKQKAKQKTANDDDAFVYTVIDHQHVTEKATNLSYLNKYVFRVFGDKNKNDVKRSVEKLYKVKVAKVNVVNVPSKSVTFGRHEGTKGGYKKAIVTLKEGFKIEIAPH